MILTRPRPPGTLLELGSVDRFLPAPDVLAWIHAAYLAETGPLFYDGHAHLRDAQIGVLWTNVENRRNMRRIVGQAELVQNANTGAGAWRRARGEQQLREWFEVIPDFVITFDALHASGIGDAEFCALVDHELCHCAQALGEGGMPSFNKSTGRPNFGIKGHDVEEFVSVIRRFGIEAGGERAVEFVLAAAAKPQIAAAKIAESCGTCLRLAA